MKHIRRGAAGVAALAAIGLAVAGCSTPGEPDDTERTLRIAVGGLGDRNWDPTTGAILWSLSESAPMYESLVMIDPTTFEYEPWLAEEYTVSEDRRSITFTLRDGVTFSDGEPLTAEGVLKEWDMVVAAALHWSVVEMTTFGAEMSVVDDRTIEITTTSGINDRFFDAITYLPIVSPAALDDLESLKENPVGTGPYVLGETVPDVSATHVRNPRYWNPEAYDFDVVVLKVYEDSVAAVNALKSGQVDAARIDISQVDEVEASGFGIARGAGGDGDSMGLIWLDWDGDAHPALSDVRVRQAISYAFDRESINDNINLGEGRVTSQVFVEGMPQYIEGGDDRYPYDPERARDLLAEAGYPDGFEVKIPYAPGAYEASRPIVEQSLADIGVRVVWDDGGGDPGFLGNAPALNYPLYMTNLDSHGLVTWLSDGGWLTGFADAAPVVRGLTDRMDNGTPEESAEAAQEFGHLVLDEAWYIPFSTRYQVWGLAPGVDLEIGNRAGWPLQLRAFSATE